MPWFEAHDTMARHPKTLKLARLLGQDRRWAVGLLHDLFSWGLYAASKDGALTGLAAADIAQALDYPPKKAGVLVGALVEVGYLEEGPDGYAIHDWYDYAGKPVCPDTEHKGIDRRFDGTKRKLANASIAGATENAVGELAATVLCAVSSTISTVPICWVLLQLFRLNCWS